MALWPVITDHRLSFCAPRGAINYKNPERDMLAILSLAFQSPNRNPKWDRRHAAYTQFLSAIEAHSLRVCVCVCARFQ